RVARVHDLVVQLDRGADVDVAIHDDLAVVNGQKRGLQDERITRFAGRLECNPQIQVERDDDVRVETKDIGAAGDLVPRQPKPADGLFLSDAVAEEPGCAWSHRAETN